MKRLIPIILSTLAISISAVAQAQEDAFTTVLAAAPANLREAATVVKWKPDFTYDTVKKGTNRLVCYDRSGFPLQQPFSIECTSVANLDLLKRGLIHGGILDGPKAKLLLTLLLLAGAESGKIPEAFTAIGVPGSWPAFRAR